MVKLFYNLFSKLVGVTSMKLARILHGCCVVFTQIVYVFIQVGRYVDLAEDSLRACIGCINLDMARWEERGVDTSDDSAVNIYVGLTQAFRPLQMYPPIQRVTRIIISPTLKAAISSRGEP